MSNVPQDEQQALLDLAREAGFKVRNGTLDADGKGVLETLARLLQLRDQRAGGEAADIPVESIGKVLAEVMDLAVANGANSVSMPDHYVEIAAWLSGVKPDTKPTLDFAAGMMKAAALLRERISPNDAMDEAEERLYDTLEKAAQIIEEAIPKESADARVPFGYIKPDPKWGETGHTGMAIFSEKVDDHIVPVYL